MSQSLPANWRRAVIADAIAEARSGFACGEEETDGVIQFRMNNVTREGTIDWTKIRRVPKAMRDLKDLVVEPGDLLFNSTNSPELIGKCAVFSGFVEPVTFSNHFLRLRTNPSQCEPRYLSRWITLEWSRGRFASMCRQWVNQASVSKDQLLGLPIPLPPLPEQRRIAAILDQAETLRAKRRQAIAKLDELKQSIFFASFGDPLVNSKRWAMTHLKDLLAIPLRNGLSPSRSGTVTAKVLTLSAITGDAFLPESWKEATFQVTPPSDQRVDASDLLICRGNGGLHLVGKAYFPADEMSDFTFPDTMIAARISPTRAARNFIESLWNGPSVRRQIESLARTTNGTFKVNQTMLEGIQLIAPPLSLQLAFDSQVVALNHLKSSHLASLAKLNALFASLQHRAFRGEL